MKLYENMTGSEKARWYTAGAKFYAEGRPAYPQALVAAVASVVGWQKNSHVLEIGSGSGTATVDFIRLGGSILCVEPNAEFVSIAQRALRDFPEVNFHTSTLEEASFSRKFDIVLAASSFHWVDPIRGVEALRKAIRPKGFVVLLWNKEPEPIAEQADAVIDAFRQSGYAYPIRSQSREETAKVFWELSQPLRAERFAEKLFCHTPTSDDYSVERFVALHHSLSPFLALVPEKQKDVAAKLTEYLRMLVGPTIRTIRLSAGHIFQVEPY